MYVYFLIADCEPQKRLKVGKSKDVRKRIEQLETGSPYRLRLLLSVPCRSDLHAKEIEKRVHRLLRKHRIKGEWFEWSHPVQLLLARLKAAADKKAWDDLKATRPTERYPQGVSPGALA